jgi:hypothetical protein
MTTHQKNILYMVLVIIVSAIVCLLTMGRVNVHHAIPVAFGWTGGVACCALVFLVVTARKEQAR